MSKILSQNTTTLRLIRYSCRLW